MGLLSGLALSLWIGFGRPKPPPPYLPKYTDGCSNTTSYVSNMLIGRNGTETDNR